MNWRRPVSRASSAAAIGFGVLVVVAGASTGHPPMSDASVATITRWYGTHRGGTFAMELLLTVAGLLLLWFVSDLRRHARSRSRRSETVSGCLVAACAATSALLVAGGWAQSALAVTAGRTGGRPPAGTIRVLSDLTWLHWAGLTLVIAAAALCFAVLAIEGAVGARWIAWVAGASALACTIGGVAAYFPSSSGRLNGLAILGYLGFVVFGICILMGGVTLLLSDRHPSSS